MYLLKKIELRLNAILLFCESWDQMNLFPVPILIAPAIIGIAYGIQYF